MSIKIPQDQRVSIEMASFSTSLAVWNLSEAGQTGVQYCVWKADGQREIVNLMHESLLDAIADGRRRLQEKQTGPKSTVLVFAAQMRTAEGNIEHAIFVEFGVVPSSLSGLALQIPYAPKTEFQAFSLKPLRVMRCPARLHDVVNDLMKVFIDGLKAVAQGWVIWQTSLQPEQAGASAPESIKTPLRSVTCRLLQTRRLLPKACRSSLRCIRLILIIQWIV